MSLNGDDIDRVKDGVFSGETTQRTWFEDAKNYYVPIQSIEISEYTGEVYDFTSVTKTLGAPFIVHNCNGVAGTYFSTPDSAALSITGSIDIVARLRLNDWTPASVSEIVAKWLATGDQRSYELGIVGAGLGQLRFVHSTLGTAASSVVSTSTVAPTVVDGSALWVRATRNSATGDVTFYTAADQESVPSAWTQLGDIVATAAASLYDSTALVEIGANGNGTGEPLAGNVLRAQIYNGIAGTLVFDFNPSAYSSGTTFLDSAGGATITLNGGSTIVRQTCLYIDGVNDFLRSPAFALPQPVSRYTVGKHVSWTSGDYLLDGATAANGAALIQTTSTPQLNLNAGSSVAANTGLVLQTISVIAEVFNGAASFLTIARQAATTGDAGAGAPNGVTIGASGAATAANFGNMTISEHLVYAAAHKTNFSLRILMWLWRKWKPAFNI
jgi:hypothetical protein